MEIKETQPDRKHPQSNHRNSIFLSLFLRWCVGDHRNQFYSERERERKRHRDFYESNNHLTNDSVKNDNYKDKPNPSGTDASLLRFYATLPTSRMMSKKCPLFPLKSRSPDERSIFKHETKGDVTSRLLRSWKCAFAIDLIESRRLNTSQLPGLY